MHSIGNQRGSVLVFVTLMIVLLLVMVGMGLDTGQLTFVRSQGQRAVDAAALAGASAVATGNEVEVYNRVAAFNSQPGDPQNDYISSATKNKLGSQNVTFVKYEPSTGTITKVGTVGEANGVRVALESANPYGGPTGGAMTSPLFLTPLFNLFGSPTNATADVNVSAVAYIEPIPALPIALAGCPMYSPPGGPYSCSNDADYSSNSCYDTGVTMDVLQANGSYMKVPQKHCTKCRSLEVPSPKDNTCYTTYTYSSANAKSMKALINNYKTCGGIPPVYVGTPINLNNGQITAVLQEVANMASPGSFSGPDATPKPEHCYLVPVVQPNTNCNQTERLDMWARICIREVVTKGSPKYIYADVTCPVSYYDSKDTKCYVPRLARDTKSGM